MSTSHRIAIIGLGYVGLPLAVEFGKIYPTIGFDINETRIKDLKVGIDNTLEVDSANLLGANNLSFTSQSEGIADCNIYIITVPTPVDKNNRPDLAPLYRASETVGKYLKKGDIVVYESTVYPGVTEEVCVPVLEKASGLIFNTDFYCGYSPERINPGDKEHTVTKILKITSGSTPAIATIIDQLYGSIIVAGTYKAPSIKVAEAAKVIENSQRDINIAFVNELSKIFNLLGIDTTEVLNAAATKWNFLKFKPGLVGGHCIGVDPYYLAQKAQEAGYHPEILLAGRRLNDSMGAYVAGQVVKMMVKKDLSVKGSNILILGITFKENCPDIRNSRVIDIIRELETYDAYIDIFDPWASKVEVNHEYNINLLDKEQLSGKKYKAIVLAVAHHEFKSLVLEDLMNGPAVIYDIKGILPVNQIDGRL